MPASMPQELLEVFERSTLADLVTVDGRGQPMAWPVAPSFDPHAVCIEVEAVPGEHDTHVALLFADEAPQPMVLVQGTAKPGGVAVRVRPERVYVWKRADLDAEPELYDSHVEEVRSAHNEEPEVGHAPTAGGRVEWDDRLDALSSAQARAALAFVGPDGFPFAVRVPVRADRAAGVVRIEADPVGAPIESGLACLCAGELRVRGDLEEERGGWTLRPHATLSARPL
jgi:hypothetical protein